ncbi:MAG: LysR family transcriptional regulator [Clostridium sp.]|uniref:LysR family transcriptional regulator n=1 Tax=Clostridium sp. TaxID=1506 RepID=UPI00304CA4DF
MDLREQKYVLAIAKFGSIKLGAEELNITPPTLSIFLSNLESNLGTMLFHRLGKKLVPTEVGHLYIESAHKILNISNNCDAAINDYISGSTGTIRFGIHPRRTLYLLPESLSIFSKLYPKVNVISYEESSTQMYKLLIDGELDFIIHNQINHNPALEYQPLYSDRLVLVTKANHKNNSLAVKLPRETLPWIDLSLFNGERFILQKPKQACRIYSDQAIAYSKAVPSSTFMIENMEAAAQLAAEGVGIAFSYLNYVKRYVYPKPTKYFLVGDPNISVKYYIVQRKDKYLPKFTNEYIEILRSVINKF